MALVRACLCLFAVLVFVDGSAVRVVVQEGSDAILPCSPSTKEDLTYKLFEWKKDGQKEVFFYDAGIHYNNGRSGQDEQFRGRVSFFPDQLTSGNASITITNTKTVDSGEYSCVFPRLHPGQRYTVQLVVNQVLKDRSEENIPGVTPRPVIVTLNQTKDWALLQCEVNGASPQPDVEWQDSSGNRVGSEQPQVSEREGRFYISLQTTVTKTDHYSCVSTQNISHQIRAETYVFLSDKVFESGSGVSISGIIVGLLLVAVLVALLVATKFGSIKLCWNRELEMEQELQRERELEMEQKLLRERELEEMKQELLRECELEMEQKLLRERKLEDRQEPRKECELEEMKQKIWREGKMKTMNLDPWRERKLEEKRREIRKECKEEEMKQKIWREDGLLQLLDSPETPAEKQNGYSTGNSKEAV
ncbi:butyrophilin subfamily 3 member A2-like isoform X9 [Parambassis ranga]|uniref:Butyrophilin subfamily 3 member A2-like isoform X9 n=1 Tax=Parambassis ranga TaxID=210632 RepID=A0A6P7K7K9_9TELE|nr:butyrophilin subfamily 3 member A2-like isoform X9 [Parambassis ranga]